MKVRKKGRLLKWLKEKKWIIIIIAVIWVSIGAINYFLSKIKHDEIEFPLTSYSPNYPIISDEYTVPEKEQDNIEVFIENFINLCNVKEYEQAYNMINDECKESVFNNNIEEFKQYIDNVFDTKKIYCIQNLSNDADTYVYDIKLLEDYLTLGINSTYDIYYKNQEISLQKVNGEYKISIQSFISKKEIEEQHEDEFINIKIDKVENYYSTEEYTVTITNNSDYIVVVNNNLEEEEILLDIGKDKREVYKDVFNFLAEDLEIILNPHEEKTYNISFMKYFDEYAESQKLIFNKVRVFKEYTGNEETYETDKLNNIYREYAIEIDLTD